jgi:hypothetical protein
MRLSWLCFGVLLIYVNRLTASAEVLTNGELTVSIGNQQSWTGRNGTGNLSYYGCDRSSNCLYLTGGKITCRDEVCRTSWQHRDDSYVLSSPITKADRGKQPPSTLTIYSDSQVVFEQQLYPKPFDNVAPQNLQ